MEVCIKKNVCKLMQVQESLYYGLNIDLFPFINFYNVLEFFPRHFGGI